MLTEVWVETSVFLIGGGLSAVLGLTWEEVIVSIPCSKYDSLEEMRDAESIGAYERQQISVNTAILYATLAIVITSVISQWPPEGQEIASILEDSLFFGAVFAAAFIVGRVTKLIYKLDLEPHLKN